MKKFLSALCALFMLLCLCTAGMAQSASVVDQADLFTPVEEAELAQLIDTFRQETQMDFVILTTDQAHSYSQQQIADSFYEEGGYGMGDDYSGILYYIDMYERVPYLATCGAMIDYMPDDRIEYAHEASYDYLAYGNYARAAAQMIQTVQTYVRRGIPEGQYRYDVLTGERLTASHKALTPGELLVCALIAGVAALICSGSVKGSYSLKGSTYDYAFRENCDVKFTEKVDDYLRTTTTRRRKAPPPSSTGDGGSSVRVGGSGVHRSSSGRSFGGGAGRKF